MFVHVDTCTHIIHVCTYSVHRMYMYMYLHVSTCRYIQCTCILHAHVHVHCVFAEVEITVGHQTISE